MSERGSFCTNYIYDKSEVEKVFLLLSGVFDEGIVECPTIVAGHIICGKLCYSYCNEMEYLFRDRIMPKINALNLIGKIRIHVAGEGDSEDYTFHAEALS